MWSVKKILVPTDLGPPTDRALEHAVDLARLLSASLTVLHVYEIPIYSFPVGPLITPPFDLMDAVEQSAKQAMDELLRNLKDRGVPISGQIRRGIPWEGVLDTAKEMKADLIIMGTHGRKGLPRALMGSVAEKVVRLSPVPVLTVRGE